MISPVIDTRRERVELARIPLFNRRFREVYGWFAVGTILLIAAALCAAGIEWLAPWNPEYTQGERKNIWFGVGVMPFAALIAASFLVEFVVKTVHVALWGVGGELVVRRQAKFFGYFAGLLLSAGIACCYLGGDWDSWGYLAFLVGLFFWYVFVILAWESTDAKRRPNQSAEPTR